MDDIRVGRFIRAARLRRGWRQADLAEPAGVSQQEISLLERGHLSGVPLGTLRRVLLALEASCDLDVRWRGGAIDRLIDERHAALVGAAVTTLAAWGWEARVEVTYSRYGEKGSIDVLGLRPDLEAVAVGEVKSDLASLEQTQRKHDEKVRLAPAIVREREGWTPRIVGRVLVLPDSRTSRRRILAGGPSLLATYPCRGREVREWLRDPTRPIAGVLLVTDTNGRSTRRAMGPQMRQPDRASRRS